jgi:hypothetical protein
MNNGDRFRIETYKTGSGHANDMPQRWRLEYEKLIDAPLRSHFEIKLPFVMTRGSAAICTTSKLHVVFDFMELNDHFSTVRR